ncbi:MAG: tyrosine-type recombinase/integrase [Planctomycetota bacterium]
MAFVSKTRKRGVNRWRIVWDDATKGAGREGRRETWCDSGDHDEALDAAGLPPTERAALANGARKADQRSALLKAYEALELVKLRDAARTRATGLVPAHETPMPALIDAYCDLLRDRAGLPREDPEVKPPDPGWRHIVANRERSAVSTRQALRTLEAFRNSLPSGLASGGMSGEFLRRFLSDARAEHGWSAVTTNRYRDTLRGLFSAFTPSARKRYFRSNPQEWFAEEVEALPEGRRHVITYSAAEVMAFLEAAERRADPDRVVMVTRRKGRAGKVENYTQEIGPDPAPVLQWALLLACTGVRRSEAAALRWNDCDLVHGVLHVYSTKTREPRYVPLLGDPQGDIAPGMLNVLKAWRQQRPHDSHVLPSEAATPCFPKHAWDAVCESTGVRLTPQGLRRTFESMLAMIGISAGLAGFWLGHSVRVAEAHYRAYRPGRLPGSTVEEALGLQPFLAREASGGGTLHAIREQA